MDIKKLEDRMISSDEEILEIVRARMDVIGSDEIAEFTEKMIENLEEQIQKELESMPSIYRIMYIHKRMMYECGLRDGLCISNDSLKCYFKEIRKELQEKNKEEKNVKENRRQ